jgi:hypothetical protein
MCRHVRVIVGIKGVLGKCIMRGVILVIGRDLSAIMFMPVQFKMLIELISVKRLLTQDAFDDLDGVVNHVRVVQRVAH